MNKYEKLKEVIQEANYKSLSFGSRIKSLTEKCPDATILHVTENHPFHFSAYLLVDGVGVKYFDLVVKEEVEILSRPIHLSDVLLAISKKYEPGSTYFKETSSVQGTFAFFRFDDVNIRGGFDWFLKKDDLDAQSEETKQFLINLLVKEE